MVRKNALVIRETSQINKPSKADRSVARALKNYDVVECGRDWGYFRSARANYDGVVLVLPEEPTVTSTGIDYRELIERIRSNQRTPRIILYGSQTALKEFSDMTIEAGRSTRILVTAIPKEAQAKAIAAAMEQ